MSNVVSRGRIVSAEDEAKIAEWLKIHHTEYATRSELVAAAFNAILVGKTQPKVNSSTTHRYLTVAGLAGKNRQSNNTSETESPLDQIRNAEMQIRDAILRLDNERNRLQQRILEIDNTIIKYKNL